MRLWSVGAFFADIAPNIRVIVSEGSSATVALAAEAHGGYSRRNCDVSLQAFDEVVPAAGAINSAVRMTRQRMADLVGADWVDVCQCAG